MFSRRQILTMAGAAPVLSAPRHSDGSHADSTPAGTSGGRNQGAPLMGGTPTAFALRARAARTSGKPFDIVEHCRSIGLAGVQTNPPSTDPQAIREFRQRLESWGMHLICDPRLPREKNDLESFETQVKAFKEAGAAAFHAAMTGRRYEDFDDLESFRRMFEQCQRSVQLADPILRKHRMRLGIENHKGWRSAEQAAWLKRLGSEWVGVCFDFGNNISLCENPMDTLRTLAPLSFFAHIKDVAVEEYEEGFLLSEVPFGEGCLDLKQIVTVLRKTDPNMIFNLEMITRDPLLVPVFTTKYWATFDDAYSPLPGKDLAKVITMARRNRPKAPLPRPSSLRLDAQVRAEDDYNMKCIIYARQNLNL
ncbi:MAG: TIM barrel protein [Acidobacteria bacterium]|nr:TIM barrel protein [Acidobacteriota bacterium]